MPPSDVERSMLLFAGSAAYLNIAGKVRHFINRRWVGTPPILVVTHC